MSRQFNGTTDFATSASAIDLSGVNQFTYACWMWANAYTNSDAYGLDLGWSSSSNGAAVVAPDNSGFGAWFFGLAAPFGSTTGAYFTRPSAAAWHQFTLLFNGAVTGTGQLAAYVDGVAVSLTDAGTHASTTNFGNFTAGWMASTGGAQKFAGRLAEVAIWPGLLLSANDAASLGKGYRPPKVRPDKLGWYWPLRSPEAATEPELIKANGMACVDTNSTDHPRVIY